MNMLKSWKFWAVMAGITGLMGLFAFGFTKDPRKVPSPLVGKPAPGFSLVDINTGEQLSNETLKGTPYILNFWASWCVACRTEARVLEHAFQRYWKGQQLFRVIGIAIQDTPEKARAFARNFGKTYYLALDNESGDIALNYGLYGVPESFFVDAEGVIRYKEIGPVTPRSVEEIMVPVAKKLPYTVPE
ncbi:MAG: redoxin domain-containing protein [Deltaproteobacteria bacterium]|nr:redoxin domain-containing protein [Deltaproteobacteria bacterium]